MSDTLTSTRINHSCHLICVGDATVLTDPWFTFTSHYDPGESIATDVEHLPHLDAVVITHEHYDHCDLDALARYRDLSVPVLAPTTVVPAARAHGFTDVRPLEAWDADQVGDLTITAAPGKHGVHEITFVIQGGDRTVYFGGDTLCIPELGELPDRFGAFDLALLPINGLCIRPADNTQVVMNAREAAELTGFLAPTVAIPHHYAFTSGRLGDQLITKLEREPLRYLDAANELAPRTTTIISAPGESVSIP